MTKSRNYDPTKTTAIRNAHASRITGRFDSIRNDVAEVVSRISPNMDARGVREKVKAFDSWLEGRLETGLLDGKSRDEWESVISKTFRKGVSTTRTGKSAGDWLKFAMSGVDAQIDSLADQTWSHMRNIASDARTKVGAVLAEGLARGESPKSLAAMVDKALAHSARRGETAAHNEPVRAHAEGQLTGYELQGKDRITVTVEWDTAGDGKVCSLCSNLAGVVLTPKEARGLIPRHPNCRCSWGLAPAGLGDRRTTKRKLTSSLKKSPAGDRWRPNPLGRKPSR